jgi:hypothetical protein
MISGIFFKGTTTAYNFGYKVPLQLFFYYVCAF